MDLSPRSDAVSASLAHPFPVDVKLTNYGRMLSPLQLIHFTVLALGWMTEEIEAGGSPLGNPRSGELHLLTEGSAPIGFACVQDQDGRSGRVLELIYIKPSHRGEGLGTSVLAALQLAYPGLLLNPPVAPECQRIASRLGIRTQAIPPMVKRQQSKEQKQCISYCQQLRALHGSSEKTAQLVLQGLIQGFRSVAA